VVLYDMLLIVHIIAGSLALLSALVALAIKTLDAAHRWHVYSGTAFLWSMVVVFITAVPLAIIKANTFLFVIAIFSVYLALSGWRYAKYRQGKPTPLDWGSAGVMVATSIAMVLLGAFMLISGEAIGLALIVFGGIGATLSSSDLRTLGAGRIDGKRRIAAHLTRMLAGTIATITAFLVTNVTFEPAFLLWLAPTVVITPLIVWWNRRIQAGEKPRGMPEGPQ
jgi:uncharacterized membrane protein YwaF